MEGLLLVSIFFNTVMDIITFLEICQIGRNVKIGRMLRIYGYGIFHKLEEGKI